VKLQRIPDEILQYQSELLGVGQHGR